MDENYFVWQLTEILTQLIAVNQLLPYYYPTHQYYGENLMIFNILGILAESLEKLIKKSQEMNPLTK